MARGIKSEKFLDRRGVGELDGILGMAGEFFETAEKQDLHANRLRDRWHRGIVTRDARGGQWHRACPERGRRASATALPVPCSTGTLYDDEGFNLFVREIEFENFNYLTVARGLRSVQGAGLLSTPDKVERIGKDEDSGNGFVGIGGDRAGEHPGAGWAYPVPIGSAADGGRPRGERRVCSGVASGDGRIGRRERRRRCGCKPGRRIDCGPAVDNAKESAAALEPDRYDARIGGGAG